MIIINFICLRIDSNSLLLKMFYSQPGLSQKEKVKNPEENKTGKARVDDCKFRPEKGEE